MCQIVDELGHMFDAEVGKVLSDNGMGGWCEQGMYNNGDNEDSVSNGGRRYEITVQMKARAM